MDLSKAVVTEFIRPHYVSLNENDNFFMRNRPYFSLSICPDGCVAYLQDGKEYVADPTHMVFLPMGISYEVYCRKTCKCKLLTFKLSETCPTPIVYRVSDNEPLFNKFEEINNNFLLETSDSHAACMSYLYEIFARLCSHHEPIPEMLDSAIRYIDNNFPRPEMTCAVVANAVGISEVYLRKLFARFFGVSPKEYIMRKRFDMAKGMLRSNKPYISGVADSCGFSSTNHFCKMFKERYGLTPSDYSSSFLYFNTEI